MIVMYEWGQIYGRELVLRFLWGWRPLLISTKLDPRFREGWMSEVEPRVYPAMKKNGGVKQPLPGTWVREGTRPSRFVS